ncbi:hypothetical protein QAD02_002723 [Eretmocerus hayati]|uniref:Uncharacterized protein n=1 Tax=Eretmocerus hayati TaxID=131215 RepID=A0ACC2NMC0_9HYME|nr:hypothetical protein QAD02_002723 [Eretmocerus hayati]
MRVYSEGGKGGDLSFHLSLGYDDMLNYDPFVFHAYQILGRLSNTLPSMQWAAQSSVLPILESLSSYNVTMDDEIECIEENQLLKVPISDLKSIDAKFIRFRKSNLITVLTGMFCRYSTLERAKRAIALDVAESLIVSHDGKILLYADQRPVLKVSLDQ